MERLSVEKLRAARQRGAIGADIELHECLDSTNARAKMLALTGAAHGAIVLAEAQTAGRGRFERRFYSPAGSGLYMSLILRPEAGVRDAALLTPLAAVAVARAIEGVADVQARIKWVNDVYIAGRKVCGILCEAGMSADAARMDYVVVGIGVNIGPMDFPEELRPIATSIADEAGESISVNVFAARLLDELELLLEETRDYMAEYRARSNVIGRDVTVMRGSENFRAHAEDIDGEGCLIVRNEAGERIALHSGEISLKL